MVSIDLDSSFNNAKTKVNRSYLSETNKKISQEFGMLDSNKKQETKYKDLIFPFGMIASGGILLYLGVHSANRTKILKNFTITQTEFLNSQVESCKNKIGLTIRKSFQELKPYIAKFVDNFVSPFDELKNTEIKNCKNINQVLTSEKSEFAKLNRIYDETHKSGPSDMDEFSVIQYKLASRVNDEVSETIRKTILILKDNVIIPPFKNEKNQDLIDDVNQQLNLLYKNLTSNLWQNKDNQIINTVRSYSKQMANEITRLREKKAYYQKFLLETFMNKTKDMNIIPSSFTLTYNKVFKNASLKTLDSNQLKPTKLSKELTEIIDNNLYLEILQTLNFEKLNPAKIKTIFERIPYDNNLKDLGILIDRLRIRQAINQTKHIKNKELNTTITKLEVLSDKLYKHGHEELFNRCSKNFDTMTADSQKKAALYLIYNSGRKLGYTSLEEMNKDFREINPKYRNLNFTKHLLEFLQKPEIYFM